ncbi:MAG: GGDEF domain-containing protein, partial [Erysipelotrichaceae bacterium]|nr:GGDEF domain-containing protein [Erysipelotrichaceae bacterium]
EFQVFYQPKFDVTSEVPILCSAEALVRWFHPKLGMVSPGVFIPLFEENGLVEKLDLYVWRKTAAQIAEWKEKFESYIPISVNVSRIDMYDPMLVDNLQKILEENGLTSQDLILEVTESAYTENSMQIIETAEKLRDLGFRIEMDDFGTGYSSLNMISSLPIDAMKLDMQFVRNAFKEGGNTRMIEVIVDIADFLSVPVIAEGVETEHQLDELKRLGCDIIQGYFFSKPVPAIEFEPFILQRKEALKSLEADKDIESTIKKAQIDIVKNNFSQIDEVQDDYGEKGKGIHLRTANISFAVLAVLSAIVLFVMGVSVSRGYDRMREASDRYAQAQQAAYDMVSGSDYLTDRVRSFVVTGELQYLNEFFEEVNVTKRRDNAVSDLEELLGEGDTSALASLNNALELSNQLVEKEYEAMRLILETGDYDRSLVPAEILNIALAPEDLSLDAEGLKDKAQRLVFDSEYMNYKDRIRENVSLCTQTLISSSSKELELASDRLSMLVNLQRMITALFLLIVLGIIAVISLQIRNPLTRMVKKMEEHEMIVPTGVEELRFVARTYNKILKENQSTQDKLSFDASHDALTGLFNRGAYELLIQSVDTEHMAMLIVDVDHFKQINDTYGHAIGDKALKAVADLLRKSFRSVDIICRFGGDEFVVVMTRVNSSMRQLVENKISQANKILKEPHEDLPPISLSVGVAFSDRENPSGSIFEDADAALYRVKEAGGNGVGFYEG